MKLIVAIAQESIAHGVALTLEEDPQLNVMERCTDLESAIAAVREFHPDLLLIEPALAANRLAELTEICALQTPATGVAVLSPLDDALDIQSATAAGARAYIGLSLPPEALRNSVALAAQGHALVATVEAMSLLDIATPSDGPHGSLSEREIDVVELVTSGATNQEIADSLHLTENTVKVHLRNVYKKLAVRNRTELAAWARDQRLSHTRYAPSLPATQDA